MRAKRVIALLLTVSLAATAFTGCGKKKASSKKRPNFTSKLVATYEAEDGNFIGNTHAQTEEGCSGTGYATGFNKADADFVAVKISVDKEDFYDLHFTVRTGGGSFKNNRCYVDGEMVAAMDMQSTDFEEVIAPHVYLAAGEHDIMMDTYWGYYDWDKLDLYTSEPIWDGFYDVDGHLVNANASDNAKRLMSYLCDTYGKATLSGQYCSDGLYGNEMACIRKETGKFPAVVGMDMSNYSPLSAANGSEGKTVDLAKAAWDAGAIVTMCWHWTGPSGYLRSGSPWYSAFYKEHTTINVDKAMSGEDEAAYNAIVGDIRAIAEAMLPLKEADVPILWRPLHEASGGWFWWGNCSAESYIALYRLIYKICVEEYELNNLIWLWNGQKEDWYPGDDVVDILGWDIYAGNQVYTSQTYTYYRTMNCSEKRKLVALSENGTIPDPDNLARDGSMWLFYATWSGEFVTKFSNLAMYSEEYTSADMLRKVYDSEYIITLDELPDLTAYPIREDVK